MTWRYAVHQSDIVSAIIRLKSREGQYDEAHHYRDDKLKKTMIPFLAFAIVILLSGCSQAAGIDDVLSNAKKQGKVMMLELGSVGCIPCEEMKPVMEKLRTNYKGKLEVYFVDVKKEKEAAKKFGVFAIPTQVFLDKNGKEFHRHIGFYAYEEIVPILKKTGL